MLLSVTYDTRCGVICWIWLPVCSVYKTCTNYDVIMVYYFCAGNNLKCALWAVIVIWNVIVLGLKWLLYLFYWLKCDGYFWFRRAEFCVIMWPTSKMGPLSQKFQNSTSPRHVIGHVISVIQSAATWHATLAPTSAAMWHATSASRWHPRQQWGGTPR
jgi:hypothetical protein